MSRLAKEKVDMVVIILEKVAPSLRGELTRWLIEPHSGVFVGHVSALVRDQLWKKCLDRMDAGGVVQVWSTNTEQRFKMRMAGDTPRTMIDLEGIELVKVV
jgi:CRISPR-associated protein Cas2